MMAVSRHDNDPVLPAAPQEAAPPDTTGVVASPGPAPRSRRIILFDVENGSRVQHVARLLDHLGVGTTALAVRFVALGNWRVVGQNSAHLLARHGAELIHTAPAPGVPDWSDLRIAVEAGVWLGDARPGDAIDIVSDDRAFDAIGDVAAGLGVTYRRVSYRTLPGVIVPQPRPRGRRSR